LHKDIRFLFIPGGGATRPLPRGVGMEEFHRENSNEFLRRLPASKVVV